MRLVIHHGAALYVQDGRELPVGPFSGNLPELVAGCPRAASHARTAHRELAVGTSAYLAGAAGVVVGILALSGPAGWVTIGAGVAVGGTGVGLMGAALTHAIDAVNLFNDAASVGPGGSLGPPALVQPAVSNMSSSPTCHLPDPF